MAVCPSGKGFGDFMREFSFAHAVTCEYAIASDILVVGALVFSAVAMFSYIRTGSVIIPLGLIMITGAVVTPFLPSTPLRFAGLVLVVVPAGIMAYAWYRHRR